MGSLCLTGLTATTYSTNQISVAWNATTGAAGYNVYRGATSGGPYTSVAAGTHSLVYFDSGLNSGTSYYYVVTVLIAGAESLLSNEAMATTFPTSAPPVVTPEHPLFVSGQGWVEAGSLGIGTSIVSRAGPALTVQSVTWQRETAGNAEGKPDADTKLDSKPYTVYNLTVEDDHTYFVGSLGGGTWVQSNIMGEGQ